MVIHKSTFLQANVRLVTPSGSSPSIDYATTVTGSDTVSIPADIRYTSNNSLVTLMTVYSDVPVSVSASYR